MKAISLWQPWASLIAYGVKTIETRSWSTPYRGRIAIHAAKTTKGIDQLPGDCEGKTEGGWVYGYLGDFQASYCRRTSDEGHRGDTQLVCLVDDVSPMGSVDLDMPLGAVVATAMLVDCVRTERILWEPDRFDVKGNLVEWSRFAGCPSWADARVAEEQRPYGDFSPGRWAWLLRDIMPLEVPIPARGRPQHDE
ncbi:MAG TPA: ASCH domain-containing protein [Acidimicrobiales bacterium]|nr:ASCH domain-containing protein [Acidimicrobiales bacterium]